MTNRRYEDMSRWERRHVVTMTVLRATASAALLIFVYYLAPLNRPLDIRTAIWFGLGLAVFVVIVIWQVGAIIASDLPRLRAVQAIAIGLPTLLVVFAATYVVIAGEPGSFTEEMGRTDALYFTITVFATVGFGDIAPVSEVARVVTMIQMLMGLAAVGLVAKVLLGAVQLAVHRREREYPEEAPTPDHRGDE